MLSGKSSTASSQEDLKSKDKIVYSGFDQPATIVKAPQNKAVTQMQEEQKRTRRRTNSGLYDKLENPPCYDKLENLPPSDM